MGFFRKKFKIPSRSSALIGPLTILELLKQIDNTKKIMDDFLDLLYQLRKELESSMAISRENEGNPPLPEQNIDTLGYVAIMRDLFQRVNVEVSLLENNLSKKKRTN